MKFWQNRWFWVVLIIIVTSLILMGTTGLERGRVSGLEQGAQEIFSPLQHGVEYLRGYVSRLEQFYGNKEKLVEENRRLREEIDRIRIENERLREYGMENRRLINLLDFRDSSRENMNLEAARVIARSPNSWYRTITIDKGVKNGVNLNMVAISPDGLVGRIISATSDSSVVLLITDREGAVGAVLQEDRIPGIVEGLGVGNMLGMSHMPYYSDVKKGSKVVTSRFSEIYPPGIYIGRVENVSAESTGLTKNATITPGVDFDKLEEVFIIKHFQSPPLPEQTVPNTGQ